MVFRRPMMSPILPTMREDMNAPTSKMATMVAISTGDGSWKYVLKYSPLLRHVSGCGHGGDERARGLTR